MERRLAAILAADVVGYSRLMEGDEAGTLALLKSRRREILQPMVSKHCGRIVKLIGDGVLVEFASAVNAVQCAVELQVAMSAANSEVSEGRWIVLRIGINLGDVMVEGRDLYGDGVNIAARLETLAEPGRVYVSETVFNHVRGKVSLSFEDLGNQRLKNISEPVRVYTVTRESPHMDKGASHVDGTSKASIAVLPFTNISADSGQLYLSDGVTEDIITELSRYRELLVIARNSSFQYRGKAMDMKRVGRELGVDYLVEGSLRKAGERLRITAQLIEVSTGAHLWAEKYDRRAEDVFAIQDEVTQTIVTTLVSRVAHRGAERARRKPTEHWAAYDCVLQAQELMHKHEIDAETPILRRALELDPDYAQAYAMLADCYATKFFFDADEETLHQALLYAEKALSIDDNDGLCHYAMGFAQLFRHRTDEAGAHLAKAVTLNPNNVLFACHHALWLSIVGRRREALENLNTAARRDPVKQPYYYQILGMTLFMEKRYEEAIQALNQSFPQQFWDHAYLAAANAHLGKEKDARAETAEVVRMRPGCSISWFKKISPWGAVDREHCFDGLRKAGLPE